ncbi:MAG: DoxX family protein [Flavobacteriaceae bacterium]|nr:DoxX family protein [Flavobacteriaceae bacterium]
MNSTKINDLGLLIIRLGFAGMFLSHGLPKAQKLFAGDFQFADPIGLGPAFSLVLTVLAEALCSILIIIGFKTKWVCIPPMITMLVAAFIIHGDDPFGKKEFALLYFFGFLAIAIFGAGNYSLDGRMKS